MNVVHSEALHTGANRAVALAESLNEGDLQDLCDATVDAINAGLVTARVVMG